jgi:hypothetical protein
MTTAIRGASAINDAEFLAAYNDKTKTNMQVIEALNTDWTAVGVKLRSARVTLHTTVERTGGKGGNFTERGEPLALEAQIWVKRGEVQAQPNGPYTSLKDRIDSGKITVDADLNIVVAEVAPVLATAPVTAAASSTAPTPTTATTDAAAPAAATTSGGAVGSATPAAEEFAFRAEIFGSSYRLAGPTKEDALHALFVKLQELNFSKVAITENGRAIGINDIRSGGNYKLAKQLTAASSHDELVQRARDAIQAVFGDKSVDAGQTAESLGNLQDEIGTMVESLDVDG